MLAEWRAGDAQALDRLLPLVYDELRRIAHRRLQRERPGHLLQTTALVHEAYLRLNHDGVREIENRAHFLAICAHAMREILVEHARSMRAAKRNGGKTIALNEAVTLLNKPDADLLALDDALERLARLDARQARIVELRFFAGLSIEEVAAVLGISAATVKRDWVTSRMWLYDAISAPAANARKAGHAS